MRSSRPALFSTGFNTPSVPPRVAGPLTRVKLSGWLERTLGAMKTRLDEVEDLRSRKSEADVGETMAVLFAECPSLCGFTVRDAAAFKNATGELQLDTDVIVADVAVYPVRSFGESSDVHSSIALALVELIERSPDARELLCGRTFARTIQ